MPFSHSTEKGRRGPGVFKVCCALAVGLLAASPAPFGRSRAGQTQPTHAPARASAATPIYDLPAEDWPSAFGRASRALAPQTSTLPPATTSHRVYREPALPVLPAAGGKFRDPVFGTELMRATDERDGAAPGLGTYYAHWPTFNADNTFILVRKGTSGDAILKRFDPVGFELRGAAEQLPGSIPNSGAGPNWESSVWSRRDPRVVYTFANYYTGGMRLYAYDVVSRRFTLLRDFRELGGAKDYLAQMSVSADDDVFAFSQRRSGADGPVHYLAWRRSDDRVLVHAPTGGVVDEVRVDKGGRFLAIGMNTPRTPGSLRAEYLDFSTGRSEKVHWNQQESPPGHGDLGTGFTAGFDSWAGGINRRDLSEPRRPRLVFRFTNDAGKVDWTEDFHGSLLAENEDWMTVGTYDQIEMTLPEYGVFEDEVFQVALDGSGRVRRVCHTRTRVLNRTEADNYWAAPKPTISRDGRFIAFTSNWEASGRTDLFIARVDPAPTLSAPAPAARQRRQARAVPAWKRRTR